ncbi:MAG TPA: Uma2 family endonuclease [Phycisphaerales bacterium]|nr:Uma2 family endonuclease [Phycisphaerales bacterium]
MSAAPKYEGQLPDRLGYAGLRMTADEFFEIGETQARYELIDGVVLMSPAPTPRHQELLQLLQEQAGQWRRSHAGARVIPDVDLQVGPKLVYRPDLALYAPGVLKSLPQRLTTPPQLVIEILSPSTKALDLITKRGDYERFGVAEYWVIDPDTANVRAWRRIGNELVEQTSQTDSIESVSLEGFTLDLKALRGD